MKKLTILFAFLLFVGFHALAQMQIKGTVTGSDDGLSIPGVSVVVKGNSTIGTTTDIDGKYTITVPSSAETLIFSFVGMAAQEVAINGQSIIDVQMKADVLEMDEVVVVAYGTMSRAEITGAVTKISSDIVENKPVQGFDAAIQGQAAGVMVTSQSGTPGGGININVRGPSSINGDNQPLYVIDGLPIISGQTSQNEYGGQETNALALINPSDIETMQVLKDAAATALYGSRAANGVVLITTKSGKKGQKGQFNFNYYTGVQDFTNYLKPLGAEDFLTMKREGILNDDPDDIAALFGAAPGTTPADYGITGYDTWNIYFAEDNYGYFDPEDPDTWSHDATNPNAKGYSKTNWMDQVTQKGKVSNYELSASGGTEKSAYFISAGYYKNDGVLIGQDFERFSGKVSSTFDINDFLNVSGSLSLSKSNTNRKNNDNNIYGILTTAQNLNPTKPVYNEDGSYSTPDGLLGNARAMAVEPKYYLQEWRMLPVISLGVNLAEGLTFKTSYRGDIIVNKEDQYEPVTTKQGQPDGIGVQDNNQYQQHQWESVLNYSKKMKNHKIAVLLGHSYEKYTKEQSFFEGHNFPDPYFEYLTSAAVIDNGSSTYTERALNSYFGRVTYNYASKYLLNVNMRADGASKFGEDNKYGYFPSASLGWVVSEENFLKGINFLSNLKLRASYGLTGNWQPIDNFASRGLYGVVSYLDQPGFVQTQLPNTELGWESTSTTNIGLDLGVFNNVINLAAEYYIKNTTDVLLERPIPNTTGYGSIDENLGEVKNSGVELTLYSNNIKLFNQVNWKFNFNIAFNKNEIVDLDSPIRLLINSHEEGHEFSEFYLIEANGIYNDVSEIPQWKLDNGTHPGDVNFVDANGDEVINADDRTYVGSPNPDYFGGFNTQFEWKGIDLAATLSFAGGHQIYNRSREFTLGVDKPWTGWNMSEQILDRWTEDNHSQTVARPTWMDYNDNHRQSSFFLEDGDYVRLRNLTLGYTIPEKYAKKIGISRARIYFTGQNLFTWTKYTGFDPEVDGVYGVDFFTYPQMKIYMFGINLTL